MIARCVAGAERTRLLSGRDLRRAAESHRGGARPGSAPVELGPISLRERPFTSYLLRVFKLTSA